MVIISTESQKWNHFKAQLGAQEWCPFRTHFFEKKEKKKDCDILGHKTNDFKTDKFLKLSVSKHNIN